MKNQLITLCFFLFYSFVINGQSNEFYIENYGIDQGISDPWINVVTQDAQQYIWFGSVNGLTRYDGTEMTNFMFDVEDSLSLPQTNVLNILVDKNSRVWTVGSKHLARLNECSQTFDYRIVPYYYQTTLLRSWKLNEEEWLISSDDSISIFDPISLERKELEFQFLDDSISYESITSVIKNKQGQFWVGTKLGLYYGSLKDRIVLLKPTYFDEQQFTDPVQSLFETHRGEILASTRRGIAVSKKGKIHLEQFEGFLWPYGKYTGLQFEDISEDKNNKLWILNNYWVWTYEVVDDRWKRDDKIKLTASLNKIYHDQSNHHWIASRDGVFKLLAHPPNFSDYSIVPEKIEDVKDDNIFGVDVDKNGDVWFAGWGLYRIDGQTKEQEKVTYFKGNNQSLNTYYFNSLYRDPDDNLWLGSSSEGIVYKISNHHQNIEKIILEEEEAKNYRNTHVYHFEADHDGDIWIARMGGVSFIQKESGKVFHFDLGSERKEFNNIDIDKEGNIWTVGTGNLLFRINKNNSKIDSLFLPKGVNPSWLLVDKNNKSIWVATNGHGLFKINKLTLVIEDRYTKQHGLYENSIDGIAQDSKGNLWLPINRAVVKFDPLSKKFTHFTANDGLNFGRFTSHSLFQEKDGHIWFATVDAAAIRFHPDSIQKKIINHHRAPMLKAISIFEKAQCFVNPVKNLQEFSVNSDSNFIAFDFIFPEYARQKNISYSYQLEGWDKDWSSPSASNHVSYANLNPGEYTFKVKATGTGEIWSDKQLRLEVKVIPQLYQKKWFRFLIWALGIFLVIGLIYYLHKKRTKKLKDHNFKVKLEALRSQLNHHFIFNTLNSVNSFIAKGDKLQMNQSLAKLASLIRTLIDHSKSEWVLLDDEINFIENYMQLEGLRFGDRFKFEFIKTISAAHNHLKIPPMIIQPFLENAVNHAFPNSSHRGLIELSIKDLQVDGKEYLKVIINDNGEGMLKTQRKLSKRANEQHKSIGIDNVRQILNNLNQLLKTNSTLEIIDKSSLPDNQNGTLVDILIPIIQDRKNIKE